MKPMRHFVFLSLLMLLVGLGVRLAGWSVSAVSASSWQVAAFVVTNADDSGDGSLRKAIQDANALPGVTSTITFATSFFSTPRTINLLTALPSITSNLTINGPGANLLTVRRADNAPDFRIFNIPNNVPNVAISGITISNGRASSSGDGGNGGGILSQSPLTLTNIHVTGNRAFFGGGVFLESADGVFTGCTFSNNTSIRNVVNGSGSIGGGIFYAGNGGRTLRIVNATLSGNNADRVGGGIYHNINNSGGNSRVEIVNSTLTNNTAQSAGGIVTATQNGAANTATTTLRNTIVANNTPNNLGFATNSTGGPAAITSLGFNLSSENSLQILQFLNQPTDFVNTNPLLGPLQDNGGPTPTHALLLGSRALDAGHSSGAATDQRGLPRRVDLSTINNERDSDGTDIGAFEVQATPGQLTINDMSKNEGNSGQTDLSFTVSLLTASTQTVTVVYLTQNGTAQSGSDYAPLEGQLTFAPGQTSQTVTVRVNGDTAVEPDETFLVNLRNATNATIADAQGQGTILNDDVPASQIVQNINDSGDGSLRKVIADAPVGGKVIFSPTVFNSPRTITLTTGELVINKNLVVEGPGAILLTVSGNNASRVFNTSASSVSLSGMTITGGNAGPNRSGGGIRNTGALAVTDSIISGNTAPGTSDGDGGGGILNGGILTVINSTISGNSTGASGGGICAIGPLTVMQSTISGNSAGAGGGIGNINGEQVTVINSTISGNTASSGGGIDDCGTLTLTNSTISGNRVSHPNGNGSGIRAACSMSVTIINSTITNNSGAGPASAVYRSGDFSGTGTVTIRNSIIASNGDNATTPDVASFDNTGIASAGFNLIGNRGAISFNQLGDQAGGGGNPILYPFLGPLANNGGPTQTHALLFGSPALDAGHNSGQTIDQRGVPRRFDIPTINNQANGDGADIGAYEALSAPVQPPTPTLAINDVSKNEGNSGQTAFDFTVTLSAPSTQTVTVDYLSGGGTATVGSDYVRAEGRLTFTPGQTTRTITVQVNGDTTVEPDETFLVELRSPSNAALADGQGQGTIVNDDVPSLIVQNTDNNGNGSLRQVIADIPAGGIVTFSPTVFNVTRTITLASEIQITKNLTINGPGANLLTISGNNTTRVLRVLGSGLNVTINNVTIRNGNAVNSIGGGILSNGTLTMNRCHLADNRATTSGGGIHLDGASGTFNACTFSGNTAPNGGGIYFNGTGNGQTLSLTNCTFSGNTGTQTGGALAHVGTGGSTATQITSCTIANNNSADGGGIYISATSAGASATATTRNSIYANNSNTNLRFVPANGGAATITSQGFNLTTGAGSGVLTAGGDQINADPLLGPLADNGGTTPTRALLSGSPAQDRGLSSGLIIDQRGSVRPFDDPALTNPAGSDGADIGAFEQGHQIFPLSAASYQEALAPASIVAVFGVNLSNGIAVGSTIPLPTSLNEASFIVRDSLGTERLAPLFFVSPGQVNLQIPSGTALGSAAIIARRNGTATTGATVMINAVEPGLFTLNAQGTGLPAAVVLRVKADGTFGFEPLAAFNAATGTFAPVPINVSTPGELVGLVLYGTGIRGHGNLSAVSVSVGGVALPALAAGDAGPQFVGLDQVNSGALPSSLAGRKQVEVSVTVAGKTTNKVTVVIQ